MRDDSATEAVRRRYAKLANNAAEGSTCCTADEQAVFGASPRREDSSKARRIFPTTE